MSNIYYVSKEGQLVEREEEAICMWNEAWCNPIPVFMYINEYVPTEELSVSCNTLVSFTQGWVFCVVAPEDKITAYSQAVRKAFRQIVEVDSNWFGEYTLNGVTLWTSDSGASEAPIAYEGRFPKVTYDALVGDYIGTFNGELIVRFDMAEPALLKHEEFLRALSIHYGYTDGMVSVRDKDGNLVNTLTMHKSVVRKFNMWEDDPMVYVSADGMWLNTSEYAVLYASEMECTPIPVFEPLDDQWDAMSCNTITWQKGRVVWAVAAKAADIESFSISTLHVVLSMLNDQVGLIGEWRAETAYGDTNIVHYGRSRNIDGSVTEELLYGNLPEVVEKFHVGDERFLEHKEFVLALRISLNNRERTEIK